MNNFGFNSDSWEIISQLISEPIDYFDFPSSLLAFANSLKGSRLKIVDNVAFFRERGNQLTLISYICSGQCLKEILDRFKDKKLKCLNFVNKDFNGLITKRYMDEFWTDNSWSIPLILGGTGRSTQRLRNKFNKSDSKYIVTEEIELKEILDIFEKWYIGAIKRHFMVIRGHYLEYIKNYFQSCRNVQLLGFRDYESGCLVGVSGFEVFKSKAQITLAKHSFGDNNFPIWFWMRTIEYILALGVDKIFCGTTADELKKQIGIFSEKSYKIEVK